MCPEHERREKAYRATLEAADMYHGRIQAIPNEEWLDAKLARLESAQHRAGTRRRTDQLKKAWRW